MGHSLTVRLASALALASAVPGCGSDGVSDHNEVPIEPEPDASASPAAAASEVPVPATPPPAGRPAPADHIAWRDVTNDRVYVLSKRSPQLRVELLYDFHGRYVPRDLAWSEPNGPAVDFGELNHDFDFCAKPGSLVVGEYLTLSRHGTELHRTSQLRGCHDLDVREFYKEGMEARPDQPLIDRRIVTNVSTAIGEVRIAYQGQYCSDTGTHDVDIETPTGALSLENMLTVHLVEWDLDDDGRKELYVSSTQGCGGWARIFRISAAP